MRLDLAQAEMRAAYLGGTVGNAVSALVWFASAALATWVSPRGGMLALVFGGMLIFPLTLLVLRLLGRRTSVSRDNPLPALAIQVAFTVPLAIPLVLAAAGYRAEWFYAGFLIVVGAHYLPFVTLYGRRVFFIAGMLMVGTGIALPVLARGSFALGGWVGGGMLLALATVLAAPSSPSAPAERHSP
jgi:hypothetical protein